MQEPRSSMPDRERRCGEGLPRPSAKLADLQGIDASDAPDEWKATLRRNSSEAYNRMQLLCSPQGPGTCDHNLTERVVNILTSLPYIQIGWHTFRQRTRPDGKLFGASVMGVGLGSIVFHSSYGAWRPLGRKFDYWMIALSSSALLRTVMPRVSKRTTHVSLALTPFQPLAVTTANALGMERRVSLQKARSAHIAAGLLGASCFVVEEFYPKVPFIHTIWHGLSAIGLAYTNCLLADIEKHPGSP